MKKTIRIISVIMIAAVLLVSFSSCGEKSDYVASDYKYVIENSEVEIRTINCEDSHIKIPSHIEGYPVTAIGVSQTGALSLDITPKKITIPETVKEIGDMAFHAGFEIRSFAVDKDSEYFSTDRHGVLYTKDKSELVQYPLGKVAKLYSVHEDTKKIRSNAFYQAEYISKVIIPEGVIEVGKDAFQNISTLNKVCLPESLQVVGEGAFDSGYITEINIPNGITSIGDGAFGGSCYPSDIVLPENLVSIGDAVFNDAKSVTIPAATTSISANAFSQWGSLERITVNPENENYTSDSSGVLYNKDKTVLICAPKILTEYVIPDSVTVIGESAFLGCAGLSEIVIPGSVTEIGPSAFAYSGLEKVDFSENTVLKKLSDSIFYECAALRQVEIPRSVTSVGVSAFSGCSSLESMEIPDGTKEILYGAFDNCSNLTRITVPDSVEVIGDDAFGYHNPIPEFGSIEMHVEEFAIVCSRNSYASVYASENELGCELID